MQFKGNFTITKRDNIDFNLLLMQRKLIGTSALVFVVITAMISLLKYMQGIPLATAIPNALLMGALGVVLLTVINIGLMLLRVNGMYRSNKISDFSFEALLDKNGFHAKSDRGNSDVPWERILSVVESRKAFYVFITESNANVLPKSQITAASGVDTLRKLFFKYLPAQKCKLK